MSTLLLVEQAAPDTPSSGQVIMYAKTDGKFYTKDDTGTEYTVSQTVPAGCILDFGGGSVPNGYLACDGSNVSRTTYAGLFSAIGTTWGVGDGSTTFTLPDCRRRVSVGSGGSGTATLGNAVGNTGGEETHTLTSAEIPSHTHSGTTSLDGAHTHAAANGSFYERIGGSNIESYNAGPYSPTTDTNTASGGSHTHTMTTDGGTGGGGAHNNMQPSYVVTKVIKF